MVEVIKESASAANAEIAIFDFDGTLSLIRSGWMDVMIPMCVERLADLKTGETETELRRVVEDFVWRLTGKETIYQMMALADAVQERGGKPLDPLEYKKIYLERLWIKIKGRILDLQEGKADPEQYLVPGAKDFLSGLLSRGIKLYLASGTDDANVKQEAALLGLGPFFDDRIYGAQDDLKRFSKALLVQQLVSEAGNASGGRLLVFGDGYVEIEEVKKVGGVAVGVATLEPDCLSTDSWKRERLIGVGADFIVPNFLRPEALFSVLFRSHVLVER